MLLAALAFSVAAHGQSATVAGVITGIKVGRGRVEIQSAAGAPWRPARPLLALRAGDEIRATEDALVVIVLSGGRGSVTVGAAGSPFVIPALPPELSPLKKTGLLIEQSLAFLSGRARGSPQAVLSTRGGSRPPTIVTPRNSPMLPGPFTFEWLGNRITRYTIRVSGPSGVVLERQGVVGDHLDYPPDAPALSPVIRYRVQISAPGHPPQEAWFEILDAGTAQAVRQNLVDLEPQVGAPVPPSSLAVLRAGFLADRGLIHDARLIVLSALSTDPGEPTLYRLLGDLYTTAGLPLMAAEAYEEAEVHGGGSGA